MYPTLPKSPADLVPLPLCDGPKLKPFDFQGPQKIDFLQHLGEGVHSEVFRVKISGQIYALKLFRFLEVNQWGYIASWATESQEIADLFYNYSESFNAECRAFGRLEEAGHADLAVKCFGYVLLDEEHERAVKDQFRNAYFSGYDDVSGYADIRDRHADEDGRLPPIRGILKELGTEADPNLSKQFARKMLRDIIDLQQLGIFNLDVRSEQYLNGKISDLSCACTTPHFLSNPELCPSLTPAAKAAVERGLFKFCMEDFLNFNRELTCHNEFHHPDDQISSTVFPGGGCWGNCKYNLRSTPVRQRPYTLVDPRSYNIKRQSQTEGSGTSRTSEKRPSSKKPDGKEGPRGKAKAQKVKDLSKVRKTLLAKPPRWYLDCDPELANYLRVECDLRSNDKFDVWWDVRNGELTPWLPRDPWKAKERPEKWDFEE